MSIVLDIDKGKQIAKLLYNLYFSKGIFEQIKTLEDIIPNGMIKGSIEHKLFITLTVSIDYQRDAEALWDISRKAFEDLETKYLFKPNSLHETPPGRIIDDMQKYKLSKKPKKDANIWRTVGVTFFKKWEGNPYNFLKYHN